MNDESKAVTAPTRPYLTRPIFGVFVAVQCVVFAAALWLVAARVAPVPNSPQVAAARPLAMATCSGSVGETPEDSPWTIALDHCDKAIDSIDVKSGFLQKWTICGGADSFAISLNPRMVSVTGDHIHCSSTKSEVVVTYLGVAKN
jgi:hypothetical protein